MRPLDEGRRRLAEEHVGLALSVSRGAFRGLAPDLREQADAEALHALVGAAARFDPSRGPFSAYAARTVVLEVRKFLRARRGERPLPLDDRTWRVRDLAAHRAPWPRKEDGYARRRAYIEGRRGGPAGPVNGSGPGRTATGC